MKTVMFLKDYRQYKEGSTARFADNVANVLVKLGIVSYDVVAVKEKKRGRPPKSENTYMTKDMVSE